MADLICERASEANSVFWLAILDCKMGSALLARLVFPALIPQEKGPFWADVTKTGSGEGQKLYLNSSPSIFHSSRPVPRFRNIPFWLYIKPVIDSFGQDLTLNIGLILPSFYWPPLPLGPLRWPISSDRDLTFGHLGIYIEQHTFRQNVSNFSTGTEWD